MKLLFLFGLYIVLQGCSALGNKYEKRFNKLIEKPFTEEERSNLENQFTMDRDTKEMSIEEKENIDYYILLLKDLKD